MAKTKISRKWKTLPERIDAAESYLQRTSARVNAIIARREVLQARVDLLRAKLSQPEKDENSN